MTDKQRRIPTFGACDMTSEEPGLKLSISNGGFNLLENAIMCASLRHWSAVSFERADADPGKPDPFCWCKNSLRGPLHRRPLLPSALPSPRCAAAPGNVITEQNETVDRAHADKFSREPWPLNVEILFASTFSAVYELTILIWTHNLDSQFWIGNTSAVAAQVCRSGAVGPSVWLNAENTKLRDWLHKAVAVGLLNGQSTQPHNCFLLWSKTLQGLCPHAVPLVRCQVIFRAGHLSWEGTSRWNHTWQRVRESMGFEIMLLIPSAAFVQDFGRALGLPAKIFQPVRQVTLKLPDQMCSCLGCGSFADLADFEQCAQVSPANEPSTQSARSRSSARGFNQVLSIWGVELFMPALAPDQRTWYKMQISIEFLEVRLTHKVVVWQFPWIRVQNVGAQREGG